MAATSNVQVQITYRGIDQASKASKSARKAVGSVGSAASKAASKVRGLSSSMGQLASGNVVGAVQGLQKTMGPSGLAGTAAVAAAGVAAVGAAAAAAAVKITRMTIETNRLAASADAAFGTTGGAGLAQALDIAEQVGGVGAENITKLAATLRSVGLTTKITNAQLQELTARATTMGKTGDEALQAFARAIESGRTKTLASVGTFVDAGAAVANYAKSVGVSSSEISEHEKRQITLGLVLESLNTTQERSRTLYDEQDRALASLDNSFLRLKVAIAQAIGGEAADAVVTVTKFTDGLADLARGIVGLMKGALIPLRYAFRRVGDTIAAVGASAIAATQGNFAGVREILRKHVDDTRSLNSEMIADITALPDYFDGSRTRIGSAVDGIEIDSKRTAAAIAAAASESRRAQAAAEKAAAKREALRKKRAARARQARTAEAAAEVAAQKASIARAEAFGATESELFDERMRLIGLEEQAQLNAARRAVNTAKGREDKITAIAIAAGTKRLKLREALDKATLDASLAADQAMFDQLEQDVERTSASLDKETEARKKAEAARKASFDAAISQARQLQGALGPMQTTLGNALSALPALGAGVATAFSDSKTAIVDAASVAGTAALGFIDAEGKRSAATAKNEAERAKALEKAERRKAAILAIMETARALAFAFTPGMQAQAASSAAAAALYAGVAGGVIKTGSSAGAGSATTGAATTGTGIATTTATADAGPTTTAPVVVNFGGGFVFGTQQQVGQAIAGSLRSLRTTGLATAGGV